MRGQRWFAIGLLIMVYGHGSWLSDCRPAQADRHDRAGPGRPGRQGRNGCCRRRNPAGRPAQNSHLGRPSPAFLKPRDYWDTSGDNKIVKAAAATFVGVPVGMYGEVKQIIVGTPQEPRY